VSLQKTNQSYFIEQILIQVITCIIITTENKNEHLGQKIRPKSSRNHMPLVFNRIRHTTTEILDQKLLKSAIIHYSEAQWYQQLHNVHLSAFSSDERMQKFNLFFSMSLHYDKYRNINLVYLSCNQYSLSVKVTNYKLLSSYSFTEKQPVVWDKPKSTVKVCIERLNDCCMSQKSLPAKQMHVLALH